MPSLYLDKPIYHVTANEEWKVYYGEALYDETVSDNKGSTCFDVEVHCLFLPG